MADNPEIATQVSGQTATATVAADDVGGVLYPRVKITLGADGAADNDVDSGQQLSAASLPVVLASDHSDIKVTLDSEAVTISGTVAVQSNSANLATEATVQAIQTAVELIDNAISGSEMQTDIVSITAGASPDIGATTDVEATGDGSIIAILKRLRTLLGGTLTVSGTVTANLSATDNAVLDSIDTAVNGTLTVDGSGVTQPISGTVTANLSATDNAVLDAIQAAVEGTLTVDATGQGDVPVTLDSEVVEIANDDTVSSNNSTTTPLAGDAAFTGTGDDCLGYSTVTVNVYADQDSAANGMTFQFSPDNSNWDDVYQFTLDASQSNNRRFQFPVTARYFRVVYTNGSTLQGAFRLQTILHRQNVLTSIHRVDDIVTTDRSAELVKAVVAAKVAEATTATGAVDGEYETLSMTGWRELRTRDQRQIDLANCNDYTVFTTLGNDTANLADSVNHLFGTGSITFDKVDGAANTVYAGVQDSFTAIDVSERFEAGSFVALGVYLPSVADVAAVFVRVGTDSSNYNEWEWTVDELTAGKWLALRAPTNQPSAYAGNGWNPASIAYVAFGVEFNAEDDTLAGIIFDNVHMVGGRVTDSTIDASVTSSVNTPNINLHRVGGTTTDTNTGNASAGTQRVVLASDQPTVTVDGSAVTQPVSASALPLPSGASTAVNQSTANTALSAIQTAVETLDNIVSGSEAQVDIVASLPAGTNLIGDVIVNDIEDGAGTSVMDTGNNAVKVNIVAGSSSGTEYTEDAAAAANPAGGAVILVRQDTPAALTSADGDNVAQRGTDYGAAFVQVVDSSGNLIDTFGGSGGTAAADDADFTAGTTQGTPVMGSYQSSPTAVTDGDMGIIGIDANRNVKVTIEADNVGIGGGTQYTEGDTDATITGTAMLMEGAANALVVAQGTAADGLLVNLGSNNDVTVTGTVDLGATDNAVLDSIATNTGTVAGAVSGSEMQVDVVGALPAGDNNIGNVDIASSVALDVSAATVTVDNAGTFAVQEDGAALTALQLIDDIVATDDTSTHATGTTKGAVIMAAATPTDGSVDANDLGALAMSTDRRLLVDAQIVGQDADITIADGGNSITVDNAALNVTGGGTEASALRVTIASDSTGVVSVDDNGSTLSIDDGGGSLTVDGTVAVSGTVTVDTELPAAAAMADAASNPTVPAVGARNSVFNGTTWDRQRGNTVGTYVHGGTAHDAADAGNPVKVGGKAYNFDGTAPGTAVAENDRANFITDVYGRQFVETAHPNFWTASADYASAQTNTSVKAAPGAGLKLYITDIIISNGATAGNITLLNGSGGTVITEGYFAITGGLAMPFRTPIALSANTALVITSTTVTTHSVTINGYIAP